VAKRKKIGRPKNAPGKNLQTLIALRLLPREAKAYRRAARLHSQSLSDWIRTILRKALPEEFDEPRKPT
jgi:uncharacterized protein (DUF1778 family)